MSGQKVTLQAADGGSFSAYFAPARNGGNGGGVIVIQEIFGVNANMRAIVDRLAEAGYNAIAPDLFWRHEPEVDLHPDIPEQFEKAFGLYQKFDVDKAIPDLKAAMDYLRNLPGSNGKVSCQGYCLGGLLAYLMAARTDINAAVGYYGVGIDGRLDEAKNIKGNLMLHIAQGDAFVDANAQAAIHAALDPLPNVTLHDYAGMGHGFSRRGSKDFDETNAALADQRTADFHAQHLK